MTFGPFFAPKTLDPSLPVSYASVFPAHRMSHHFSDLIIGDLQLASQAHMVYFLVVRYELIFEHGKFFCERMILLEFPNISVTFCRYAEVAQY